jgi:integrase
MPPRRRRRGYIEELPSGSHRTVVYAGIDPLTGTLRYIRETTKTYDEAEQDTSAARFVLSQPSGNQAPRTDLRPFRR